MDRGTTTPADSEGDRRLAKLKGALGILLDFLWPRLTGQQEAEPDPEDPQPVTDEALLSQAENALRYRLDEEHNRADSVESRLLPFLALASLIATILLAGVPHAASGGSEGLNNLQLALVVFPLLFIGFQILLTLNATLTGLRGRPRKALSLEELHPNEDESPVDYRNRILNSQRGVLAKSTWMTTRKFEQLEVAHTALRNVLFGVGALALSALIVAGMERWEGDEPTDGTVESSQTSPTTTAEP